MSSIPCGGCGRATGGPYRPGDCRLCWLYAHDAKYREHWGGDPRDVRPRASSQPAPRTRCHELGDPRPGQLGVACLARLRDCALHGVCTTGVQVADQNGNPVACCATCPDHTDLPPAGKAPTSDHLARLNAAAGAPPPSLTGSGRGVVMAVGGTLYFGCAWVVVSVLRKLGCTLPVQWWHLGPAELDPAMTRHAARLGVECVDALAVASTLPQRPRILNGWELKPFAVLHCPFREVLFLDADSVPVRDPTELFDDPGYRQSGALFWPDLPPGNRAEWVPATVWHAAGMPYRNVPAFESGQFLVDRVRCARELAVTVHLNEHSDYWYQMVYGDKDTFLLAWHKCGTGYAMSHHPAGWTSPAIQQYAPDGRLAFQHVCKAKGQLAAGRLLRGIRQAAACAEAAKALRAAGWSGRIWDWGDQTEDETALAGQLAGTWYYDRIGLGGRELDLLAGGQIGRGRAACEDRWTIRVLDGTPTLVISGAGHKGTVIGMVFATEGRDGLWRGAWQAHERGPVVMRPPVKADILPWWWQTRPGTWDWAMFDSVVVHDEYGLADLDLSGQVVLDLGAHTGCFAHAAFRRGAAAVHCYEPEAGNRELLQRNVGRFGAVIHPEAIGAPGRARFVPCQDPANTGGGAVVPDPGGDVAVIGLDEAIRRAGRIGLLKLDIEGAEWVALAGAARLDAVERLILEWHAADDALPSRLADRLRAAGFADTSWRRTSPGTGYLRASRL